MIGKYDIGRSRAYNHLGQTGNAYSPLSWPNAQYFSDTNETWFVFDRADGLNRDCYVRVYDHDTESYRAAVKIDDMTLTNDEHGYPTLVRDGNGRVLVFYDSHATTCQVARTTDPNDETSWDLLPDIVPDMTYTNPVLVGNDVYLFYRGEPQAHLAYIRHTSTTGNPSWSAEKVFADVEGTDRCYPSGTIHVVGTDVYIPFTRSNNAVTIASHCYFGVLDTTDDSFRNMADTFSLASGSQPADSSELNTNYQAFGHTGGERGTLSTPMALDDNNYPHIIVMDGDTGDWDMRLVRWTGSAWTNSLIETDTISADTSFFRVGDDFGLVYHKNRYTWTRGASHVHYRVWNGSTWSDPLQIGRSTRYARMYSGAIKDGHDDAKMTYSEVTSAEETEGGDCRGFVWGPGGYLKD